MKKQLTLSLFIAAVALLGCDENGNLKLDGFDDLDGTKVGVITLDVSDVRMFSATLMGRASLPNGKAPDFEIGFEIASSPTYDDINKILGSSITSDGIFTYTITGNRDNEFLLMPGKTYYINSFMYNDSCMYRGATKTFTMMSPEITTGIIDTLAYSITSNAVVQKSNCHNVSYGVCIGTNSTPDIQENTTVLGNADENGSFTIKVQQFPLNETFYYRAFVLIDQMMVFYGESRSAYIVTQPVDDHIDPIVFKPVLEGTQTYDGYDGFPYESYLLYGVKLVSHGVQLDSIKLFNNACITFSDGEWGYSPKRYWDLAASEYKFIGIAPATVSWDFVGSRILEMKGDGTDMDILIAKEKSYPTGINPVVLYFRHILSRVDISASVTESFVGCNVRLDYVMVTGLKDSGQYTKNGWITSDRTYTFGTRTPVNLGTSPQQVISVPVIPQEVKNGEVGVNDSTDTDIPYLKLGYSVNDENYTSVFPLSNCMFPSGNGLNFEESTIYKLDIIIDPANVSFRSGSEGWD